MPQYVGGGEKQWSELVIEGENVMTYEKDPFEYQGIPDYALQPAKEAEEYNFHYVPRGVTSRFDPAAYERVLHESAKQAAESDEFSELLFVHGKEPSVPYQTEQTTSDKVKSGKTIIKTYGQNGIERIVAAVSYVDGVKVGEEIISTTVTKQPVNQKVVVGTKKKSSSSYYGGSYSYDDDGSVSSSVSKVLKYARSALGIPYVFGGTTRSGFDCSGFTAYVYSKVGKRLPHSAAAQSAYGSYVSRSNLRAGDLVFFDTNGGHNNITHVGIYMGGGKFIDASSSRPRAVTIDSLNSSYYSSRYMTARRILK